MCVHDTNVTNTKMNLLALDTCTESCSAALSVNGEIFHTETLTRQGHSALILGMIESLFNQARITPASLDRVVFGRGPGSFTGVRISTSVAQGIAFAHDLPVTGVSTLAAIAQQSIEEHHADKTVVALDARMGEVYFAQFFNHSGLAVVEGEEQVMPPEKAAVSGDSWVGAGSGFREYPEKLSQLRSQCHSVYEHLLPQAVYMLKLAENSDSVPAAQALPVYLRDNVAKKKEQQGT